MSYNPLGLANELDYQVWDWLETGTFVSHTTAVDTPFHGVQAMREEVDVAERAPSGGAYAAFGVKWNIPVAELVNAGAQSLTTPIPQLGGGGPFEPKPGDFWIDPNGVKYTILRPVYNEVDQIWECEAVDLVLAYGLTGLISVQRVTPIAGAIPTDNAGGRIYPGYTVIYSHVLCRIQPLTTDISNERGKRITRQRFSCIVQDQLDVTIEDQVIDENGRVYEVVSTSDPERIDELQKLELEIRWAPVEGQ